MKKNRLAEKKWYNGAVIACIGVTLYVVLTHLGVIFSAAGSFLGNFNSIFLGIVMAYILNPLARFFYNKPLGKMKPGNTRWYLAVTFGIVTALLAVIALAGMLIPQLVQSVGLFSENYDKYAQTLLKMLEGSPLKTLVDGDDLRTLSQNALESIAVFVKDNAGRILAAAADSGKGILSTVIALILAVYLLIDKKRVMKGVWRFARAVLSEGKIEAVMDFGLRCDIILMSYLWQSLLESMIVGFVNAIFMFICGMEYVGLISVIVAVTNLIPNFGPVIGGVIGAFVLVLVNPVHALMFIVFACLLQFVDGYILKPKLFSGSLGVSGLLILIAGIVLGNLFGVLGMLLSIPASAIVSFVYQDYFLPRQEQRRALKQAAASQEAQTAG